MDIAVISLRWRLAELAPRFLMGIPLFCQELLLLGYQPVNIEEIGLEPSVGGADIFSVGYPDDISKVGERHEVTGEYEEYMSRGIGLPALTFGKVSMLSQDLPYFWGDLRIGLGSSGSPVIEDGKVVGIVRRVGVNEIDGELAIAPFARATKASVLQPMLEAQIEIDRLFDDPKNLSIIYPKAFLSSEDVAETERQNGMPPQSSNSVEARDLTRPPDDERSVELAEKEIS